MPRIYVNARYAQHRVTGVQRYAAEVVRRLGGRVVAVSPPRIMGGPAGHLWEQCVLPAHILKTGILWSPANSGPLLLNNQVLTIHDLSVMDHPEWFAGAYARWYRYLLPRLAAKLPTIITVSEFSRTRILEHFHLEPAQVEVIYPGVDESFRKAPPEAVTSLRAKWRLAKPYVLTLGSIEPRKNLGRLLEAWAILTSLRREMELVVAGTTGAIFRQQRADRSASGVRWLDYVPDEDLSALYSGATVFVFPSMYEGFGLPPLEAMACGTPVICSNMTSLPEVAGSAALLVDPYDVRDIAQGMDRLVRDDALRAKLRQEGFPRARQYNWDLTAERTWEILVRQAESVS